MRPDCQLRAFNAEVTASSIIAPLPCPHSCPPVLVPSFGMTGRVALDGVLLFPSMTPVRRGHDGPRQCLPATLGLPYSSSNVFPSSTWALSLILKQTGVPKSFGPTIYIYIYIYDSIQTNLPHSPHLFPLKENNQKLQKCGFQLAQLVKFLIVE